ncbi:50S ribosomal protein L1 [Rickettsia endosymbiont of Cardiosporidium cionae]|uniref:50S ribosomal protein L1 n=1 Tax=Rickettsia endosymbiont of Cardiosporidium cionae TaxID=2777155 RepID=UPI001893B888|nr:50S ribosomal protein L1 [Rickettsia endosymbiont of Cardiosporidium cionae]KAF8818628.1 50S ribosomal protein L1 [Rickettsia endosymbiont of Cardiosporidium cionae]
MGKKLRQVFQEFDKDKFYSIEDAVSVIKKFSFVNFDETLDIAIKLGVDPRNSSQMVRGTVVLPAGTGRSVKVAVICKDDNIKLSLDSGADMAGSVDIIDNIKKSIIDFDVCITTPDMMSLVAPVAKILGPKGLMPNPKLGTVTTNLPETIRNIKNGQVEYRIDKSGIIHSGLGKISFIIADLVSNIDSFLTSIVKAKPDNIKGSYLKKIFLSSTMGPSVKIDLSSISIKC